MEDDEIERIRARKLAEMEQMVKKRSTDVSPERPIILTDANFTQVVNSSKLVLVDFWAAWCAPCRAISSVVKELGRQYAGKLVVGKMNVDENREIPLQFGIQTIPTLLLFKDGEVVDMVVGAFPRAHLEGFIKRWM